MTLGPAKFRGVEFQVDVSERSGGRRTVLHEYPLREVPYSEDLGLKARVFHVEGFVVGPAYEVARDALIAALETKGPGELVHPYHGTRRCAVSDFRVRESTGDGGVAKFSIEFHETPAKPAEPTAAPDTGTALQASVAAAKSACGAEFLSKYNPGVLLGSVTAALSSATRSINKLLSVSSMGTQALAGLRAQVDELHSTADALVHEPANMLATHLALFEDLADGLLAGATALVSPVVGLLALYDYNPGVRPPSSTATREIEQANFDAAYWLTQRLVVIEACRIAGEVKFSSYDEAVAIRSRITALIDDQAEMVSDDVYPVLLQMRASLVAAVPGDALERARLLPYTPPNTLPSLVLAHELYGSLDLEADVVARNNLRHPGFVTGGEGLEVLSSG